MLRVTTLYASSASATASYYTRYLAAALGEVPGVWSGAQADGLGLGGTVDAESLRLLLEGRDPTSGTPLGYQLLDRVLSDGRVVRAVAGFDATFSAPKSLSVLWALMQDARLLEAHDVAVSAALAHLERFGSTTRVRADGRRLHPDSQGLTMATFRQTTSRADDPQIHTHAVISAKVRTGAGRWLALDARYLKKHQRMLGGLYQSVLRNELTHRFGVGWEPIVNGQAEITGMPAELLATFSKRTSQVDDAFEVKLVEFRSREGRDPSRWERAALTREAAGDTRGHKTGNGVPDLLTRWLTEAAHAGVTPQAAIDWVTAAGAAAQAEHPEPVTVKAIVDALSVSGSTWNRADVLRSLCDLQGPLRSMSGSQWASALEEACDRVIGSCVELDPATASGPRRRSDGRSMWLEPIAAHYTSNRVLDEETRILAWAIDAQTIEPRPSTTVDLAGLDVLQGEVARAVAGGDRLVLAVGPAGAGKTITMRAAVDDLHRQGRRVFGIAPSAKAARVLERETRMPADTLAKLLHEWQRKDRGPLDHYRLPAGTSVIVDEAGMVGTSALAQLIDLADQQQWRLALVGDHHQLQAVGRGGLFHELCTTGRAIELCRIHRFSEPWEAAASLELRCGNPGGLDAYFDHGRIIADTFDHHLTTIAERWLDHAARGESVAITPATNAHVEAVNAAIQRARVEAGQLDELYGARLAGGEHAHVGDVVVTRRNNRQIVTSSGEPIRNRELWTVAGLHPDGAITVSSPQRHDQVTLPGDYTREHVRLGYAATEHGNQADTVTIGIELATAATIRRGLYVAVTRGRQQNLILVVTEHPDLDEARDVLEAVLASDRADIPATTQRRTLAQTDRRPAPPAPVPRCPIPPWFDQLRSQIRSEHATAAAAVAVEHQQLVDLQHDLVAARQAVADAARRLGPFQPALDHADQEVHVARQQQLDANHHERSTRGLRHRTAVRNVRAADANYDTALAHQQDVQATAAPVQADYDLAYNEIKSIERTFTPRRTLQQWSGNTARTDRLGDLAAAIDHWYHWASGQPIRRDHLASATQTLRNDRTHSGCQNLAAMVDQRITHHADIQHPSPTPPVELPTPTRGIGLER